ncbi:hypothetical protein BABINDRAFT_30758 [Babjeviella inositovora NRRL Y-12698]|uniref:Actin-related protein 2/3 complex subunit 5 n=1 Tax=Babjeviella inositovora NRRL Y-12698 TaxID=984486 RepID=A0A1E3QYQ4_9ASCO|nr:uncharacterized protein BABINDRAFT_30758 [Babjeviella inositovora NRRL Y-12698]ODQ82768.1 hypothetical protein BABINDRAFT_30758 [Babjeviella inositovora NRRL Y-12698]
MEDWRRIDIDALNTDSKLTAEDLKPNIAAIPANQLQTIQQKILLLQSTGQPVEALRLALTQPPYGNSDSEKDAYAKALSDVLVYNKNVNDIKDIVLQLDKAQQDNLVKYLYKIMNQGLAGSVNSGVILNWYDQLTEITGLGPVVRYLSDRRTV